MLRKFSKLLVLALAVLLLLPSGVLAGEVNSWADYHFEGKPKPTGLSLIVGYELTEQRGMYPFVLNEGRYKFLSFKGDTLYGTVLEDYTYEIDSGIKEKGQRSVLKGYTNPSDLQVALGNTPVSEGYGSYFYTVADKDALLLVFKADAKSAGDLLYTCKVSDLADYDVRKSNTSNSVKSNTANSKVALVSSDGTTGTFRLTFNLGNEATADSFQIPELNYLMVLEDSDSNGIEFTLDNLKNKTYSYFIESENGVKYDGTFNVDFTASDNSSGSVEDELAEEKAFDKIPNRKPKVKITGFPTKAIPRGTPVTLTITSDIASDFNFNGDSLNDSNKVKSAKFEVSENGVYTYSVNTGRQVLDDTVRIGFFEDILPSEDAVNKKLDTTGVGSVGDISTQKLAQTGIESNSRLYIMLLLAISGVIIALTAVISHKKGARPNEEN